MTLWIVHGAVRVLVDASMSGASVSLLCCASSSVYGSPFRIVQRGVFFMASPGLAPGA